MSTELTLGQKRVGFNFNPSENPLVKELKTFYAERIDELEAMKMEGQHERNRTISRAQTHAEDACMLSVKAIFQ